MKIIDAIHELCMLLEKEGNLTVVDSDGREDFEFGQISRSRSGGPIEYLVKMKRKK